MIEVKVDFVSLFWVLEYAKKLNLTELTLFWLPNTKSLVLSGKLGSIAVDLDIHTIDDDIERPFWPTVLTDQQFATLYEEINRLMLDKGVEPSEEYVTIAQFLEKKIVVSYDVRENPEPSRSLTFWPDYLPKTTAKVDWFSLNPIAYLQDDFYLSLQGYEQVTLALADDPVAFTVRDGDRYRQIDPPSITPEKLQNIDFTEVIGIVETLAFSEDVGIVLNGQEIALVSKTEYWINVAISWAI